MNNTRQVAEIIENPQLDYTILRCAYMSNDDLIDYELTEKGTPFKGTIISRKSIADLIVKIIKKPTLINIQVLGFHNPIRMVIVQCIKY